MFDLDYGDFDIDIFGRWIFFCIFWDICCNYIVGGVLGGFGI